MTKIKCACECSFNVETETKYDLDASPHVREEIAKGRFLSYKCPACGSTVKTEFHTHFIWKSKKTKLVLIPEKERMSCLAFCAGATQIDPETGKTLSKEYCKKDETPVIGYGELADRIAVLEANLEPHAIEAVKFFLLDSAKDIGKKKIRIYFERIEEDSYIEFHVHGLKDREVAIMKIPLNIYTTISADIKNHKKTELFDALYLGPYLSYTNIFTEGESGDE